jgi:hypothetical protein
MADINSRNLPKMKQCFDYLRVVMPVNDIGGLGKAAQLVCHFNATASDLLSHGAKFW